MRLKTLFFPIMLIISVSIFIGYIWPEIFKLKEANELRLAKTEEFQGINVKKAAIDSIGNQISNSDSQKIVEEYLPGSRVEERIVNGVNYLATDAGVSLVNISLTNEVASTSDGNNSTSGLAAILNPIGTANATLESAPAPAMATAAQTTTETASSKGLKTIATNISISGDYGKIKIFFDNLQRMSILNTVKSVVITKQSEEKSSGVENQEASSGDTLLATAVVDFGYMFTEKLNNQKVDSFKQYIDNETIDVLKGFVSQKGQLVDVSSDAKGKSNPFISN